MECVSIDGTIIYIAMITKPMTLNTYPIVYKEIDVKGSLCYTEEDFKEAMALIAGDVDRFGKLVTHCYPKEEVQKAFEMMDQRSEGFVKVVVKM